MHQSFLITVKFLDHKSYCNFLQNRSTPRPRYRRPCYRRFSLPPVKFPDKKNPKKRNFVIYFWTFSQRCQIVKKQTKLDTFLWTSKVLYTYADKLMLRKSLHLETMLNLLHITFAQNCLATAGPCYRRTSDRPFSGGSEALV